MPVNRAESKELVRLPEKGKISGVCAGIAEYFGFEVWVVRLTVLGVAIWTAFFAVGVAYVIAIWLLDEKQCEKKRFESEGKGWPNAKDRYRPSVSKVWRTGHSAAHQVAIIDKQFKSLESRLRHLERYVTSSQFQLKRKFKDIQ